jgi:hypothetical protein
MTAFVGHAQHMPVELWDYLLHCAGGYVAISLQESRYVVGPVELFRRQVQNVAFVSVEDLASDNHRPLHVLGHLVDHYLGCGGDTDGAWLTRGGGMNPTWQEAGSRLQRLFSLGYGVDEAAQSNVQDYLAQSLALFCRDRAILNAADPQIYKWFRSTLWSREFWQVEV